jgi:hypothetical protein
VAGQGLGVKLSILLRLATNVIAAQTAAPRPQIHEPGLAHDTAHPTHARESLCPLGMAKEPRSLNIEVEGTTLGRLTLAPQNQVHTGPQPRR